MTQGNVVNLGLAPDLSMGLTYTVMADTIGRVMHNAATAQQSMQAIGSASTTTVCALIVAVGVAS